MAAVTSKNSQRGQAGPGRRLNAVIQAAWAGSACDFEARRSTRQSDVQGRPEAMLREVAWHPLKGDVAVEITKNCSCSKCNH